MEFGEGSVSCAVAEPACSHSLRRKISVLSSLSPFVGRIFSPTHINDEEEEGEKDNKIWGACGGRLEHLERKSVRPGVGLTESFLCLPEYFD